jgi:hypothetical protein
VQVGGVVIAERNGVVAGAMIIDFISVAGDINGIVVAFDIDRTVRAGCCGRFGIGIQIGVVAVAVQRDAAADIEQPFEAVVAVDRNRIARGGERGGVGIAERDAVAAARIGDAAVGACEADNVAATRERDRIAGAGEGDGDGAGDDGERRCVVGGLGFGNGKGGGAAVGKRDRGDCADGRERPRRVYMLATFAALSDTVSV